MKWNYIYCLQCTTGLDKNTPLCLSGKNSPVSVAFILEIIVVDGLY
jgi:hypothetical protein